MYYIEYTSQYAYLKYNKNSKNNMLSKKRIIREEVGIMLSLYPIVTWFQITQKTTKRWNEINVNIEKGLELHNPETNDYKYFQIKSRLLELELKSNTKNSRSGSACQGRLLVYGCKTPELLGAFVKALEKEQGGFMVGGLYGGKTRAYHELERLQNLDKTAYVSSLPVLNSLGAYLISLKVMCDFSYLNNPYYNLCHLLEHMKTINNK